ncbi:hypothetical protein KI387_042909 [Taxus chinensis]|uniref:Retrovirus-related Pol polyprotein from transposon TNT 1-94 n=1 Tax=Taxus chinensis TaxID=29808 RepID=A0AA38C1R8_TAXCH|nr:hypothetical protein KI387_042909 [Taxus chinensis]
MALLSEEMRWKSIEDYQSKDALYVRGRTQEKSKKRQGQSKSRSKSKTTEKDKRKCWNCGKMGHFKKDCRSKKVEKGKSSDDGGSSDTKPSNEDSGDLFLVASSLHACDSAWLIDSGASFHMTPHKEWFCEYEKCNGGDVYLGDNSTCKIIGHGRIKMRFKDGRIKTLPGVLHIPGLTRNLISVSKMNDAGVQVAFSKDNCKMVWGAMVLARGIRTGTLFKLEASVVTDECNSSVVLEEKKASDPTPTSAAMKTMLWHQRMGHIGEKGLRTLKVKGMVEGISECPLDFDFCEHCVFGKQTRVKFPMNATRSEGILHLIHSDVFGPVKVPSLGKSMFYVSFIDDFSRNTWVYFIQNKSEVFNKFKEFKALVENQTERKIKVLRSDNGGEYCSNAFEKFCKECGIERQKTTPYTPQQNGVAERMNKMLMDKCRSMLSGASLDRKFWAEAVATVCYLVNRSPTSALEGKTPQEAWTGYKLWNLESQKVVFSRNVIFRELKEIPEQEAKPEEDHVKIEEDESVSEFDVTTEDEPQRELQGEDLDEADEEPEDVEPENPILRRSDRLRRAPERYSPLDFHSTSVLSVLSVTDDEPKTVKEAFGSNERKFWKKAMEEEMESLYKNNTWDLVKLPPGRKQVGCKWVFKKKYNADGKIEKYKARLVAKGFSQVEGLDFGEIFSLVAKLHSIRFLLAIVAAFDLEIEQMDVKTMFLHGELEEEIYMTQPESFKIKGKEDLVCRLKKSLYGLKQSPRMWNQKFDRYVLRLGLERSKADPCVYFKHEGEYYVIIVLYVDDMLLIGNSKKLVSHVKSQLSSHFDMKDLGAAKFILGMEIKRDRVNRKLVLNQRKYLEVILQRFQMHESKPVSIPFPVGQNLSSEQCPKTEEEIEDMSQVPYASAVGSLMYAMVCTRLDIAHAVGVVRRFMSNPWKGTLDCGKENLQVPVWDI